jgi:hypothetical protein
MFEYSKLNQRFAGRTLNSTSVQIPKLPRPAFTVGDLSQRL